MNRSPVVQKTLELKELPGKLAQTVWRFDSLSQRILRSILTVGALTAGVKLIAFLKEILAANRFGVSSEMD
ncbi:MAG: hypothetical protein AAGJ31_02225, partial [Verrucomicrobiota bacterium]